MAYNIQKYSIAPDFMPEHVTWFKWEAYATWIFGFSLLVLVYYLNLTVYPIDTSVMDIDVADAVPAAAASLVIGWFIYDLFCRSWFGRGFTGRGAFLQVGALVGSIVAANVLFIIIPFQRKTVTGLLKGEEPDPIWGQVAKQRSVHNNYLTFPVVFTMPSDHYSFFHLRQSPNWS